MKYSLITREITTAGARGISLGLRLYFNVYPDLSHNTFSISKSYTSIIVLHERAILKELIIRIGLVAGAIFSRIAQ